MRRIFSKFYDFCSSWTGTIIIVLFIIFFIAQAFVIPSGSMKNTLLIGDYLFVKKYSYGIPTPHIPFIEIPVLPDSDGDGHLIASDGPKRGDIVVFRYPKDPKIHYVKRNFATGLDEVIFAPGAMYLRPSGGDDEIAREFKDANIVILSGKKFIKEPYKMAGIHYDNNTDKDNYGGLRADTFTIAGMVDFAMSEIMVPELPRIGGLDFNAYYFRVPQNEYFMVGDNRENSSDSRFWGSVPYKYIVGTPWFVYLSYDENYKIRWDRIGRLASSLEDMAK